MALVIVHILIAAQRPNLFCSLLRICLTLVVFSDHDLIAFNRQQNRMDTAPKTFRCRNYRWYDHEKQKDDSISDSLQAFNRLY